MKQYGRRLRLSPEEEQRILQMRGKTVVVHNKIPKYLILDIETLPCTVFAWGLYKQRIPHDNIVTDWVILSWSAKWFLEDDVFCDVLTPEECLAKDDSRIMESLWQYLEDADAVIGHNARKFDLRKINARFLYHKIKPPTPYQIIDTLKESQKTFGTSSHRLDYLGKYLTQRGKVDTDFDLWKRCFQGEQEALDYMLKYNIEDVRLLEEVYVELMPYIRPHPNFAIFSEATEPVCVYCGSNALEETNSVYVTSANRYYTIRCKKCGGIMRHRRSDITKEERDNLLISIAR